MPFYDYRCEQGPHDFDARQKISDPPLTTCPDHPGAKIERLIRGGSSIVYRGSGWTPKFHKKEGS